MKTGRTWWVIWLTAALFGLALGLAFGAEQRPGVILYGPNETRAPPHVWPEKALAGGRVIVASISEPGTEEATCQELVESGLVAWAEPDSLVAPARLPDDPLLIDQWHLWRMEAQCAWDFSTGSPSVLVAICDTGVLSTHPDLVDSMVLPGYNSEDGTTNTEPVHFHGTMVAGCVGATGNNGIGVVGVNWHVGIVPVRVTNREDGYAWLSSLVRGVEWAAQRGCRVANCSYGAAGSPAMNAAGLYLREQTNGILCISAGNEGCRRDWLALPGFLAVSATTPSDTVAGWSNCGAFVDIAAPGCAIWTTSTSWNEYSQGSGTSFSSPLVAGTAALLWAIRPELTADQVEQYLFEGADDLGPDGGDIYFGAGRANMCRSAALAAGGVGNQRPVAVAQWRPAGGEWGDPPIRVNFDASASYDPDGEVVRWQWDFRDGSLAEGPIVCHTFTEWGHVYVQLKVTDNEGAVDYKLCLCPISPLPIYVASIELRLTEKHHGQRRCLGGLLIRDLFGRPVPGAAICLRWSGLYEDGVVAHTDAHGTAKLSTMPTKGNGAFRLTVVNLLADKCEWRTELDVETWDEISTRGQK